MSVLLEKLDRSGPKRLLALDGGGVRGMLMLGFIERLEDLLSKRYHKPDFRLCDYFDLIGGTSTGAIIAAGLAIGMSAKAIKAKYLELGHAIFGRKNSIVAYLKSGQKYDPLPLDKILKNIFGHITLGDESSIRSGLCIVTKRADTHSTWPFINHPRGKYYEANKNIPLWQILRASVAAPTYFLPIVLDLGQGEKGAFIDGGISMDNNPALRLYLLATLQGYPFRWPTGEHQLMLLSLGTGLKYYPVNYNKFMQTNLLDWAAQLPEFFLHDANYHNQLILQLLSQSPHAVEIDSEIGRLEHDSFSPQPALSYIRYNVPLNPDYLKKMALPFSEHKIREAGLIDKAANMDLLAEIGVLAAEKMLLPEHFAANFDVN